MFTIYLLTNKITGKIYIGVTNNYKKRLREHKHTAKSTSYRYIERSIRKYGWENFTSNILEQTIDKKYAYNILEPFYIEKFKSNIRKYGYNLTSGGEGTPDFIPSFQTRQKMANKKIGRKLSSEHKNNISKANKGHIVTDITKEKISKSLHSNPNLGSHLLGIPLTSQHKEKLSDKKSKNWIFISPKNEIIHIHNLKKFCQENNLHDSAMHRVFHKKSLQHKGWTSF